MDEDVDTCQVWTAIGVFILTAQRVFEVGFDLWSPSNRRLLLSSMAALALLLFLEGELVCLWAVVQAAGAVDISLWLCCSAG